MTKEDKQALEGADMPEIDEGASPELANGEEQSTQTEAVSTKPSKKSKLNERYKKMFPDKWKDDDEEENAGVVDEYLSNAESQNSRLREALESDPRLAQVMMDVINKKRGAGEALARYFGKDLLTVDEGDESFELIKKADEEYRKDLESVKKASDEYEKNFAETYPIIEEFCNEKGYDKEDFLNKAWQQVAAPIFSGMWSKELCLLIDNGLNYESDVNDAMQAGEIKGRNMNINKLESKQSQGDGLPKGLSSGPITQPKKKDGNEMLELAMNA